MKLNYYQVLGVSRDASTSEIKKAYRLLVFHFHPDRSNMKSQELQRINEAYRVLSNELLRKRYDFSILPYDTYEEITPKLIWINNIMKQSTESLESIGLSEVKGRKKDALNLKEYLSITPSYNNIVTSDDPIVRSLKM